MPADLSSGGVTSTISAANITTAKGTSAARLQTLSDYINTSVVIGATPDVTSVYTQDIITNFNSVTPSTIAAGVSQAGISQPIGYKFNLPPHDWSLPVRPITMEPNTVGFNNNASFHGLRRGRIWYWAGANNGGSNSSTATTASTPLNLVDTAYGFQFLWNPTTITTSVSRNMNITPSSADALRVVSGVFPGQETVNLSIVIDRTNDFACIRAEAQDSSLNVITGTSKGNSPFINNLSEFQRHYNSLYPGASVDQDISEQLSKLMSQGTMADLEYLFKAINSSGNGNLEWSTLLGKKTANVGYLAPTLLGIQLGPTIDNLSYVGWASSISITHTAFTETMIPIRTEVSIAIQCFAGSGLTSGA